MRAHTASGTGRVLGLASEPTAAWFVGNLIRGSAPASGTGASLVLAGVVARAGDGVFVLAAVAVVVAVVEGVRAGARRTGCRPGRPGRAAGSARTG